MTSADKNIVWVIAYLLGTLILITFVMMGIRSCGNQVKPQTECSSKGSTREGVCPAGTTGRIIELCDGKNYNESFNDCKGGACSETVFDRDVLPLVTAKCFSCHANFIEYDVAKAKAQDFIDRITSANVGFRMPKGLAPLAQPEIDKFSNWKKDGLLPSCGDGGKANPHIALADVTRAINDDLGKLNTAQQADARYITIANKSNEGAFQDVLKNFERGVQKATNSLSQVKSISLAKPVDPLATVFRLSLRELGLKSADWELIIANDPIGIVDDTNIGKLNQQLTRTRRPFLTASVFVVAAYSAKVYHAIMKIPASQRELFAKLGADLNTDLASFDALFVGLKTSQVAIGKNRLLVRLGDAKDGWIWFTEDILDTSNQANNNLLQAPLIKSASGHTNFLFDGSETLFSLPNGLMGSFLSNAAGIRVDEGPINLVQDYLRPAALSSIIFNPLSCSRCHNNGLLPHVDEIRAGILRSTFQIADLNLIDLFYRDPAADFAADNLDYQAALSKLGILASDQDQINLLGDSLRLEHAALSVASEFYLTEDELKQGIEDRDALRAQIGDLLKPGGIISFQQLKNSAKTIRDELQIGVEDVTP